MNSFTQTKDLKNKTVVITGASSGVGRAAAIEFARHGAKLVLAARRDEALAEVVNECREYGSVAIAVPTDVTDEEAMKNLAKTAVTFSGEIDVWVNNAGVLAAGMFEQTPMEVHNRVIQINLVGYLNGAHAVLPYFKQQQHGILINNISVGGWFPVPYSVGYSASKFGLRGFSEALRGELAAWKHIYVCNLFPAFLDTPGIQHAANYTGAILRPAPPVSDPLTVARKIVSVARRPRRSTTIGSVATFLRLSHLLFPSLSGLVTAKVIKTYVRSAEDTPATTGNLFQPVGYGTSIHGGWSLPAERSRKTVAAAALIGIAAGAFLLARRK